MTPLELKLLQLISGKISCKVIDDSILIHPPQPLDKYEAALLYNEVYQEAELMGVFDDIDIKNMLISSKLWSEQEETELSAIPLKAEALRIEMYTRYVSFQSNRVERARHLLGKTIKDAEILFSRRHAYDSYTCSGLAFMAQIEYLILQSTYDRAGNKLDLRDRDDQYVKQIINEYCRYRLSERDIRELSKLERWKSIWIASKSENSLFGVPSILLTDDQRSIISWSKLYDNICEHPDKPDKPIMEDDDLLDGWLILENRKSEQRRQETKESHKMSGAQEIFIPVETAEDARRVDAMNEGASAIMKRQRMNLLKAKGTVSEEHMPDSKLAIVNKAHQMMKDRIRKR